MAGFCKGETSATIGAFREGEPVTALLCEAVSAEATQEDIVGGGIFGVEF